MNYLRAFPFLLSYFRTYVPFDMKGIPLSPVRPLPSYGLTTLIPRRKIAQSAVIFHGAGKGEFGEANVFIDPWRKIIRNIFEPLFLNQSTPRRYGDQSKE